MSLEEKKYIREVLIILTPEGLVEAAHQVSVTNIYRDGVYLTSSPSEGAVAVQSETLALVLPDGGALYAQMMTQNERITQLQAEEADTVQYIQGLINSLAFFAEEIERLKLKLAQAQLGS